MGIRLLHLHLHGLFRSHELELGRDADTGGQTLYVLELVRSLAQRAEVEQVDVVTRLIQDRRVDLDYSQRVEDIAQEPASCAFPLVRSVICGRSCFGPISRSWLISWWNI